MFHGWTKLKLLTARACASERGEARGASERQADLRATASSTTRWRGGSRCERRVRAGSHSTHYCTLRQTRDKSWLEERKRGVHHSRAPHRKSERTYSSMVSTLLLAGGACRSQLPARERQVELGRPFLVVELVGDERARRRGRGDRDHHGELTSKEYDWHEHQPGMQQYLALADELTSKNSRRLVRATHRMMVLWSRMSAASGSASVQRKLSCSQCLGVAAVRGGGCEGGRARRGRRHGWRPRAARTTVASDARADRAQ